MLWGVLALYSSLLAFLAPHLFWNLPEEKGQRLSERKGDKVCGSVL